MQHLRPAQAQALDKGKGSLPPPPSPPSSPPPSPDKEERSKLLGQGSPYAPTSSTLSHRYPHASGANEQEQLQLLQSQKTEVIIGTRSPAEKAEILEMRENLAFGWDIYRLLKVDARKLTEQQKIVFQSVLKTVRAEILDDGMPEMSNLFHQVNSSEETFKSEVYDLLKKHPLYRPTFTMLRGEMGESVRNLLQDLEKQSEEKVAEIVTGKMQREAPPVVSKPEVVSPVSVEAKVTGVTGIVADAQKLLKLKPVAVAKEKETAVGKEEKLTKEQSEAKKKEILERQANRNFTWEYKEALRYLLDLKLDDSPYNKLNDNTKHMVREMRKHFITSKTKELPYEQSELIEGLLPKDYDEVKFKTEFTTWYFEHPSQASEINSLREEEDSIKRLQEAIDSDKKQKSEEKIELSQREREKTPMEKRSQRNIIDQEEKGLEIEKQPDKDDISVAS
jgi:hypothetical protein